MIRALNSILFPVHRFFLGGNGDVRFFLASAGVHESLSEFEIPGKSAVVIHVYCLTCEFLHDETRMMFAFFRDLHSPAPLLTPSSVPQHSMHKHILAILLSS